MSLPNYLAKIKSSGIYRFVWDKSEIAGVDAEILRLVVGYCIVGEYCSGWMESFDKTYETGTIKI